MHAWVWLQSADKTPQPLPPPVCPSTCWQGQQCASGKCSLGGLKLIEPCPHFDLRVMAIIPFANASAQESTPTLFTRLIYKPSRFGSAASTLDIVSTALVSILHYEAWCGLADTVNLDNADIAC